MKLRSCCFTFLESLILTALCQKCLGFLCANQFDRNVLKLSEDCKYANATRAKKTYTRFGARLEGKSLNIYRNENCFEEKLLKKMMHTFYV
jgi:hypothetical protein